MDRSLYILLIIDDMQNVLKTNYPPTAKFTPKFPASPAGVNIEKRILSSNAEFK